MTEPRPQEPSPESPGPVRTWWHPMLVSTLRWILGDAYEVREEVSVGRLPPRIDILILRRLGEPPEIARRELATLMAILNDYTLIQFKGPTDALATGDLDQFLGCVHLFRGQQRPPPEGGTLSAVIFASSLTSALREDARRLSLTLEERDPGVWEAQGGLFPLCILEADRIAAEVETVLAFFSRAFLEDPRDIMERWQESHRSVILHFLIQQIQQFKSRGETFAMQHKDTQIMDSTLEELQEFVLSIVPPKKRLEGLSPEERLEGLSPEERLEGLSLEERLRGLNDEELQTLQRFLQKRLPPDAPDTSRS